MPAASFFFARFHDPPCINIRRRQVRKAFPSPFMPHRLIPLRNMGLIGRKNSVLSSFCSLTFYSIL